MAISNIAYWVNDRLQDCVKNQGELSSRTVKILNYTDTLLGIVLVVLGALVVYQVLPPGVGEGWAYFAIGAGVVNILTTLAHSYRAAKKDLSDCCCSDSEKGREMEVTNPFHTDGTNGDPEETLNS